MNSNLDLAGTRDAARSRLQPEVVEQAALRDFKPHRSIARARSIRRRCSRRSDPHEARDVPHARAKRDLILGLVADQLCA